MLESKLAMQTVEVEKLIMENQRLASSHVVLRQDIVDTEKEMQMIRTHLGEVQTETDLQIRDLLERIRLMEADIHSGDAVKKELHQVHMEAKRLITERQMLTLDIDNATKELQKFSASGDGKSLPELLAELDGLRKEHHNLRFVTMFLPYIFLQLPELCVNMSVFSLSIGRSQFEFEKNTNIKQVEQMRTMEMNLITMTKQAEKLRGDVTNAERRAQAAAAQAAAHAAGAQVTASQPGTAQATAVSAAATDPYAGAYASYPSAYQQGAQAGAYQQGAQAGAYQQGAQAGAYQQGTQVGAYQQGTQAGAYQQGNQVGAYTYAYDAATAYAYAGYSGYAVAGYAQSSVPNYSYAVPPQPSSGAATDAASLYGAAGSAGYPTGQVQPSSATANAAQPPPPRPTAPYPSTYDEPRGAQR
ncbi:unnamed protein product [Miscanthus lutarioriparius]|uniref:Uncharacterized protein n=1 Tax=Miscanthus lutarioriparius TaxID=422564 RepID=A0A811SKT6_9POAL|nr:unnamed protein product [Miscanthus lutarioriparius]